MTLAWKDRDIELTANRIKAVAHPVRLAILCLLAEGEQCVGDIQTFIGTSQPNITQHLAILHNLKLLRSRKEANRIYYAIGDPRLSDVIGLVRQLHCPDDSGQATRNRLACEL